MNKEQMNKDVYLHVIARNEAICGLSFQKACKYKSQFASFLAMTIIYNASAATQQ
jgi:hypothetical protein